MRKLLVLLFSLPLLMMGQNTVCFTIEANQNADIAFSGFTKHINVLDCFSIYAESNISDIKVLHAAAVAAELLDNNEDGIVDDSLIQTRLQNEQAFTPIFSHEGSNAENLLFNNYQGNGVSAVLYNNEIDPTQTGRWGYDATLEEIIHTINHIGHVYIYPGAFRLQPNSSLMSDAMDVARGGQFINVPNTYPSSAWYHYDDWTCDYECMMIEYLYWAIVSFMGILDDPQTAQGISNEWELYNSLLLATTDILIYDLITDTTYKLPLSAPDGNYCPATSPIIETYGNKKIIRVTDLLGRNTHQSNQTLFYIYNDGSVEKKNMIIK